MLIFARFSKYRSTYFRLRIFKVKSKSWRSTTKKINGLVFAFLDYLHNQYTLIVLSFTLYYLLASLKLSL